MTNDNLALLLQSASEGERTSVIAFLEAFKSAELVVPEKLQNPRFDFLPAYPDRPLNILALQDGDTITVPVFSAPNLVQQWSNRDLSVRSMKSTDLIRLLPEDWWLALNPGADIRKDFSPWELSRLLGTQTELEEIATELELEFGVEPLSVRKLTSVEYLEVRAKLKEIFSGETDIKEILIGLEQGQTVEGSSVETLLVGIKVKDLPSAKIEAIRTNVRDQIALYLIGALQLRVLMGVGFSDLELGIFADFPPEVSR